MPYDKEELQRIEIAAKIPSKLCGNLYVGRQLTSWDHSYLLKFAKTCLKYGVTLRLSTACITPRQWWEVEVSNLGFRLKEFLEKDSGAKIVPSWSRQLDDALGPSV
ncbi:hypothetical protein Tco_1174093 [Tanacetum coccineum]